MRPSNWGLSTALTAAGLSAACCTIPLALVSLGIGGAWMGSLTALTPYRWIFVTMAVGALAYAGYNEWWLYRQPDCECETAVSPTSRRAGLGQVWRSGEDGRRVLLEERLGIRARLHN